MLGAECSDCPGCAESKKNGCIVDVRTAGCLTVRLTGMYCLIRIRIVYAHKNDGFIQMCCNRKLHV